MAASVMLLLVTWYVAAAFLNTSRIETGADLPNLNLLSIDPLRDGYSERAVAKLCVDLPLEVARVAGVRAVTLTTGAVPSHSDATRIGAPHVDGNGTQLLVSAYRERIGANYFATLGLPVIAGREFDQRDSGRDGTAVLSQSAASELFGADNPIGRRVREGEQDYTLIGVARDLRAGYMKPGRFATMFLPLTAESISKNAAQRITLIMRGTSGAETVAAVRDRIASLYPDLGVFDVHTMQEDITRMNRFAGWTSAMYLILGCFLVVTGLDRLRRGDGIRGGAADEGDRYQDGARRPVRTGARIGDKGQRRACSTRHDLRCRRSNCPDSIVCGL